MVTAQKREQAIEDVPIAVDAFTPEMIADRNIVSIADVANQLPGITFSEFSGSGNISIRGVGTAIVSGAGENSVAVHIDGVFLAHPQAFPMIQEDLGGIEVLRGPQGSLYGRNSTGGVINFMSAAPTEEFAAQATFLYGNFDRIKTTGYVSGPISDTVRARLAVQYEDRDGYRENLATGQDLDDLDAIGGRLGFDLDMNENWVMEARISARKEDFAGPVYDSFNADFPVVPPPLSALDPRLVLSNQIYDSDRTLIVGSLRNVVDFGSMSLVSITGITRFEGNGEFDGVGSLLTVPLDRRVRSRTITQEFNLSGSGEHVDWLVGLFYLNDKVSNMTTTNLTALSPGPVFNIVDQSSVRNSVAAFGDVTWKASDTIHVFAGLRVLYEDLKQDLSTTQLVFGTPIPICSALTDPQSDNDTAVTGRAGVQFFASDNSMIYGQYSRGYKVGGFSQSTCNNPFKPETVNAFEIGYKGSWPDAGLTLNLAAFYYDYKNLQLEQATPTGIPVVNAPKSSVLGGEIELVYAPNEQFSIDIAGSFLDAKYDRFINTDPLLGVAPGVSLKGVSLNNAPGYALTVGVEFRQPLGNLGDVLLRAEAKITDHYNVREFDLPWTIQGSYELVNLYATFTSSDERYQLHAFVKNLTNKNILGGVLGFGGALGSFQPPRTYGFRLSLTY